MKKKKFLTKINNLEDISVSVEYYKEKYFPDILKEKVLLEYLVEQIKPYLASLRGTPHGKRIMAKINNVK